MTQDEIIAMAREAGIDDWWHSGNEQREVLQVHLVRFANLVAARELEECAKVADSWGKNNMTATFIAEEIRQRGQA